MDRITVALLVSCLLALTGCVLQSPERPTSRGAQEVAPVDAPYPLSRNSTEDVEAARAVALSGLPPDVAPNDLRRAEGARDQIPLRWWDEHSARPYKVVEFLSMQDVHSPNDARRARVTVVQQAEGAPWVVLPGFDVP